MRHFLLILCLAFCLLPSLALGQDSLVQPQEIRYDTDRQKKAVRFDEEQIRAYQSDSDFEYVKQDTELTWWDKFKRWLNNIWMSFLHFVFGDFQAGSFLSVLVQVLPYVIIAGILGFIIWLFLRLNPVSGLSKKDNDNQVILSEEEKIITQQDIPALIEQALAEQNFRLAIRYYYLLILKLLKDNQQINYEYQKTNHDYLAEIKSAAINKNFEKVTYWYDYIWYGSFPVDLPEYQIAERYFNQLKNQLNRPQHE